MRKVLLNVLLCIMVAGFVACSCGKNTQEKVEYSEKEGYAEGTVNLDAEKPIIKISDIKAKVGAEIDYLSGVIVENEDKFEDLKIWVDESGVDIYEPGDYKAKYTFEYDDKSIEYEITVTIIADESEQSAAESDNSDVADIGDGGNIIDIEIDTSINLENVSSNEANSQKGTEGAQSQGSDNKPTDKQTEQSKDTQSTTTKGNSTDKTQSTTTKSNSSDKTNATTTTKAQTATKATGSASQTTSRREMITSKGNLVTEVKDIGYSYIQLLSGSTVSIKCTTSKYIVSTRTDVSYTTKKDTKYKVSKLVIRYNTGDERTLETVEEKCN